MSPKKLRVGVAALVGCGLTTVLVAVTASGAGGATAPVGSGKQTATKSVCGLGTGKKATVAGLGLAALVMTWIGFGQEKLALVGAAAASLLAGMILSERSVLDQRPLDLALVFPAARVKQVSLRAVEVRMRDA